MTGLRRSHVSPDCFGHVAVLLGGSSPERDVSLMSGERVLTALKESGIDAVAFDPASDDLQRLCRREFDRCFIALHGASGEDGRVQGFLDTVGIPYTGSGVLASALAMDKSQSKKVWSFHGLPTPDWLTVRRGATPPEKLFSQLGSELAVKPARAGSTQGLSCVRQPAELSDALALAHEYDSVAIIEPWMRGLELTGAILGDEPLPLIAIRPASGYYDYRAKYLAVDTQYDCPAQLEQSLAQRLRGLCLEAFRLLGARDWGRVDFILTSDDRPWLLEVNTVPGLTDHSLVPMAAHAAGISFQELIVTILSYTLKRENSDGR